MNPEMHDLLKMIYHLFPFWFWAILGWTLIFSVFISVVLIAVFVTGKDDQNEDK